MTMTTKIRSTISVLSLLTMLHPPATLVGQDVPLDDLATGQRFIPTKTYTLEEDRAIIKAFEGLRVVDVADGLDIVGLFGNMLVDPEIKPLWKDTDTYGHRIVGVAVTTRFIASNEPLPGPLGYDEFRKREGSFYWLKSMEHFQRVLREGSVVVLEDAFNDVGTIGSANILEWVQKGAVGVVTNSTARDTDEIIAQKVPLYFRGPGRGIRPWRNELESVNLPIQVGGVQVRPGDVIIGDGDGIVCVPREVAADVAAYAHAILRGDKEVRRKLYEELGLPTDSSIQ
jgi:4-hydroxy-4-methyl-2-oxoglutarate aldolase